MKHLKKFENFAASDAEDMGRFTRPNLDDADSDEQDWLKRDEFQDDFQDDECPECSDECPCGTDGCPSCGERDDDFENELDDNFDDEFDEPSRRKVWGDEVIEKKKFNFEKKKGKKEDKEDKDEKKGGKGLTASQKKLPAGLQKAILARKKK